MGNRKILLFGGTAEGQAIAEFLAERGEDFTLCVATDFGREMARHAPNIFAGRLSREQIEELLGQYDLIIDATHPYAALVTENIKTACENTKTEYRRVLRPSLRADGGNVLYFPGNREVIEYLNTRDGNILLTTGSKEAVDFTGIKNFAERVYVRMLPLPDALQKCLAAGFKNSHLICLQGNFSKELNVEIIKMTAAKYIVTKDTGEAGGFMNKLAAASETGAEVIVISRPREEEGLTLAQTLSLLQSEGNGDVLS